VVHFWGGNFRKQGCWKIRGVSLKWMKACVTIALARALNPKIVLGIFDIIQPFQKETTMVITSWAFVCVVKAVFAWNLGVSSPPPSKKTNDVLSTDNLSKWHELSHFSEFEEWPPHLIRNDPGPWERTIMQFGPKVATQDASDRPMNDHVPTQKKKWSK